MEDSDALIQHPVDGRHAQRPRELAMSAAWHGGLARRFETTDGLHVNVVFHGHWSHGFGPDFSDAMIVFDDAALLTGAVEIHTKSSDWYAHGHHLDARYDAVVLHVVSIADGPETRRADGKIVPVAILNVPDPVLFAIDQRLPDIWAELGGSVCAERTSRVGTRTRSVTPYSASGTFGSTTAWGVTRASSSTSRLPMSCSGPCSMPLDTRKTAPR